MDSLAHNPITRIPISCSFQISKRPCQWFGKTIHFSHSKHNDVSKCFLVRRSRIRAGLEEIVHNQVLVSATVAGLGGQLLKPFVPAVLGRGFNLELALNSGGMPSSHSSSVVATATAIGLERGFSDSLFGLSVVIAGIIMYDAQDLKTRISSTKKMFKDDPRRSRWMQRGVLMPEKETASNIKRTKHECQGEDEGLHYSRHHSDTKRLASRSPTGEDAFLVQHQESKGNATQRYNSKSKVHLRQKDRMM